MSGATIGSSLVIPNEATHGSVAEGSRIGGGTMNVMEQH